MKTRFFIFLFVVVSVVVVRAQQSDDYSRIAKSMELFGAAFREIATEYVDKTDPQTVMSAGIRGMLDVLDPYSTLIENDDYSDIDFLTSGQYVGFGFSVGRKHGVITITDVKTGFPAATAGIRIGDQIVRIDGLNTDTISVDSLRRLTNGKVGSKVTFKLVRLGLPDTIVRELTRESIPVRSVEVVHTMDDNIGYISLKRFTKSAGTDVREAYLKLAGNNKLSGLIIDLRGNPGGLLDAAIDVSEIFLPPQTLIVTTIDRFGNKRDFRSSADPLDTMIPLVLLLDGRSASASEVFAGAIQDNDRGIVVGEPSFGKGLVQTMIALPYDASIKMTTARYYSPSGRCIQKSFRTAPYQTQEQEFLTRSGRIVRALNGIMPDSIVTDSMYPSVVASLIKSDAISSFATQWAARREVLPPSFRVDRQLLEDFYRHASTYKPESRTDLLSRLQLARKQSQQDHASDATTKAIDAAVKLSERDLEKAMRSHASLIGSLIDAEIHSRFGTDVTRAVKVLSIDPMVNTGRELLRSGNFATFLGNWSREDQ
ncbi:MAG: PDZ domain-containing protein [Ignavibacteria bacterium]|nr:PDZ domain-containing protein [Ignavibacteria bacterium]